jgi:hypothetical protein
MRHSRWSATAEFQVWERRPSGKDDIAASSTCLASCRRRPSRNVSASPKWSVPLEFLPAGTRSPRSHVYGRDLGCLSGAKMRDASVSLVTDRLWRRVQLVSATH